MTYDIFIIVLLAAMMHAAWNAIVKGAADAAKDDEAVQAEFANQREYMERALEARREATVAANRRDHAERGAARQRGL